MWDNATTFIVALTGLLTAALPLIIALTGMLKAAASLVGPLAELLNKKPQKAAPMPSFDSSDGPKVGLRMFKPETSADYWEEQRKAAHEQLGIDSVNEYNIAFCGVEGAGKSSLINAMRGIKEGEAGYAPVGEEEASTHVASYRYKNKGEENGVLWEIPGSKTSDVPIAEYFMSQKLFIFDFLAIVCQKHIDTEEKELAEKASYYGIPYAFVRSKCDEDLKIIAEEMNGKVDEQTKAKFIEDETEIFAEKHEDLDKSQLFFVSAPVLQDIKSNARFKLEEDQLVKYISEKIKERRQ